MTLTIRRASLNLTICMNPTVHVVPTICAIPSLTIQVIPTFRPIPRLSICAILAIHAILTVRAIMTICAILTIHAILNICAIMTICMILTVCMNLTVSTTPTVCKILIICALIVCAILTMCTVPTMHVIPTTALVLTLVVCETPVALPIDTVTVIIPAAMTHRIPKMRICGRWHCIFVMLVELDRMLEHHISMMLSCKEDLSYTLMVQTVIGTILIRRSGTGSTLTCLSLMQTRVSMHIDVYCMSPSYIVFTETYDQRALGSPSPLDGGLYPHLFQYLAQHPRPSGRPMRDGQSSRMCLLCISENTLT